VGCRSSPLVTHARRCCGLSLFPSHHLPFFLTLLWDVVLPLSSPVLGVVVGHRPSRHLLSLLDVVVGRRPSRLFLFFIHHCSLFCFLPHDSPHTSLDAYKQSLVPLPPILTTAWMHLCYSTKLWFPQFMLRGSVYLSFQIPDSQCVNSSSPSLRHSPALSTANSSP
jgi:hypothetical protein